MFLHLSITKFVNLIHQAIQKITVVRNDDYSALKFSNSLFQNIFRSDIQMVGRFVEYQEIGRTEQELYHCQTTTLPTGKHFHFLVDILATKHKSSEYISDFGTDISHCHSVDGIENAQVFIEKQWLILSEIGNFHQVAKRQFSLVGNFTQNTLYQG